MDETRMLRLRKGLDLLDGLANNYAPYSKAMMANRIRHITDLIRKEVLEDSKAEYVDIETVTTLGPDNNEEPF